MSVHTSLYHFPYFTGNMDVPTPIPHCYPTMAEAQASFHVSDPVITNSNRDNWYQSHQFSACDSQIAIANIEQSGLRNPYAGAIEAIEEDGVTQGYRSSNFPTFFHPSTPHLYQFSIPPPPPPICNSYLAQPSPEPPPVAYANTAAPYCNTYISPYTSIDPPYCNIAPQYITIPLHCAISQPYSITPATSITKNDETPVNIPYFPLASDNSQYNTSNPHSPVTNCISVHEENNFQHQPPNSQLFLPNYNSTPLPIQYPNDQQQIHNPTVTQPSYPNYQPQLCTPSLSFFDSSFPSMVTVDVDTNSTSVTDVDGIIVARTRALETEVLAEIVKDHEEGLDSTREVKWGKSNATAENEEDEAEHQVFVGRPETKSSAAAKLLHGNETQTVTEETNEDHGSSDYFNDTSEEYHSNQKLCLQHEQIEASKSTLADRGAEILVGIICVREDSVYNDSVDVGNQESTEEATVVEETTKIDFEGNLCMDGAHHDLDGQLSLAGEKGMEITCSNSGDVKEIRTYETSIGETSSPIIFEETKIDRTSSPIIFEETNIDRAGIMCSASAGLSVTVSDYSLHCQKQLKGSDESMARSLDETSRKVGEEEEPQEVIEAKENDDPCLFKVNVMQNTEEEVYSPGSEESEQENQLKILFVTPDTKSASLSEQQTLSQSAEISAVSMSSGNNLKKSILGRFSHGRSLEVVELKEKEVNKRSALKSKGEEITGKGSNNIDEEIASPGPLGFIKVMFEDGNEPVEGNVKTPFGDLLEESGGYIEISAKAVVAAYSKYINSIAIAPNDSLVCSGYQECIACILRLPDLVCVIVISGHKRGIWSIEFSLVNQWAITTSGNKTIKIWVISDGSCLKTFEGHTSSVLRASILTHGTRFVSCWADGLLKLWTVKTNEYVVTYDQQKDRVWALVLGKKIGMLATGGSKAVVNLWHDSTASDKDKAFPKEENGEDGRSSTEQLLPLLGQSDIYVSSSVEYQRRRGCLATNTILYTHHAHGGKGALDVGIAIQKACKNVTQPLTLEYPVVFDPGI